MITVIGSINMDLFVETERMPVQGETVLGQRTSALPGGKGANQAVAVARLGGDVHMIGCVGEDAFGDQLVRHLASEQVDTARVRTVPDAPTGMANIILSEGDNRIIVVPGANYALSPEHIEAAASHIVKSRLVVVQLEIPAKTVLRVLTLCHEADVPVLLNPAPASAFSPEFMNYASYVTPNESECREIFGLDYEAALERYPNRLIVTLGRDGAQYFDGQQHIRVKGYPTTAVDTTGAGDTFNGALAYALTQGYALASAVEFANAAASLSVEKHGAQGGMPGLEQVLERLGKS